MVCKIINFNVFSNNSHDLAWVGRSVASVCLSVFLFVRTLTGKRLELSTPNLVHMYSIAVSRNALTESSKGQRSRSHGTKTVTASDVMVASDSGCRIILYCAGVGLHVDTTAYVFEFYIYTLK